MLDITGTSERTVVEQLAADLGITREDNADWYAELERAVHADFLVARRRKSSFDMTDDERRVEFGEGRGVQ